ncbi:ribonucleotide-diphosphate reductase subunit beta [Nakamurella aerolata]|uniref:Uncharacterized protein n=1 Tax=Nakamurella aerolata TaxID=1656892 RepID=A0A849AAP4_9ACTN|nr:ribonucleotide-diphosphate reductase subunit beta [Nakamurella aerolata]NNG36693.1 hypothetical protein [Nakamurella aerolata]
MSRWSTLLMDSAQLSELPKVPVAEAFRHADLVAAQRPVPLDLYRRWEQQQWSAEQLTFDRDRALYSNRRLPSHLKSALRDSIATFIIGEYTGLDMLGPILTGSPDESYSLFLGTQIADETRHSRVVFRMGEEVLGLPPDPRTQLASAWQMVSPAHAELAMLETSIVRELNSRPLDYRRWLQAVTLFHFITEGLLALVGQRALVHLLRDVPMFDSTKSVFLAMCRDESRHIGFGLHALRTGMAEGHAETIYEVLEKAVPLVFRFDSEFSNISTEFHDMTTTMARRHLTSIGADQQFANHLMAPWERRTKEAS